ncbi:MAG: hypothetical protein U9Q77_14165 [Candidatus Marinimicrobia bacterium]|nr:hypothetical protein [Candidatus Neomarinimicrobiota bacterium]
MVNIKKIFGYLLIVSLTVQAQVGNWNNLPTLTEIRTLLPLEDKVILASNGGVLVYTKSQGTFTFGIHGEQTDNLDVNSIFIDSDSLLWVGSRSPGPIVEVIDLVTNLRYPVEFVDLDQVNSFVQIGDSVYATYQNDLEGGILLYRKTNGKIEYLDQFSNFPDLGSLDLTSVGDIQYLDGKLIFRTTKNILWVELDGSNLKDPINWNIVTIPSNDLKISSMISYGDIILAGCDNILYEYDFQELNELVVAGAKIIDIPENQTSDGWITMATAWGIYEYNLVSGDYEQLQSKAGILSAGAYNNEVWLASTVDFLSLWTPQTYAVYSANRPRDHFFNRMLIVPNGDLVGAAHGGISIQTSLGWRTIRPGGSNSSFDEGLYNWDEMIVDTLEYRGNAVVEDLIIDHDDNLYFALQGRGVLKLGSGSVFYDATNAVLEPTFDSDAYILPTQMAVDSHNNVWLTTKFIRQGGNALTILGSDGAVHHVAQGQTGIDSRTVKSIAIDNNDLVWIGSQVRTELQASGGIHFIDFHGNVGSTGEYSISSLKSAPLASNEILQLEVDARNTLWILTPSGVQSMLLPDTWRNSTELKNWASIHMTTKDPEFYYYWQLTDYNVTGIEIDQRGNHWFLSSNAGVHVLQDNGRWINGGYGYNTGNSDLLDNEIYSIAFDPISGQTYFSTPKGISILNTPFADPKENYSSIHIYPQPFNPTIHEQVIIQGLMDHSSVKILTISGTMVRELTSQAYEVQGFEAHWDGRDTGGDLVGSGVYLLYLFNEDGAASSQKLAVLR